MRSGTDSGTFPSSPPRSRPSFLAEKPSRPLSTILIIVLLILLLGGGGYYGHSRYGGTGLGGVLGLVLVIAVVVWLVGGLGIG
jgi:hypothetical protein